MKFLNKDTVSIPVFKKNMLNLKLSQKPHTYLTDLPSFFRFPHISSKYFKNVVFQNEEIVIPLYITDYFQKEYLYDDSNEKFNLFYQVDDNEIQKIGNISAGDYELKIDGISETGDYEITIYVEDRFNIRSHVLYKSVLVVNEKTYPITAEQTYVITQSDLDKYNINCNDSSDINDMNSTMTGLTLLLEEIKNNGYRKAILKKGIYRMPYNDRETPVLIPSEFTLDMNGATFKQNPISREEYDIDRTSILCQMRDCIDSHLINGILDGDYVERLVVDEDLGKNYITGNKGEGVWAFNFFGECKYCSFENMEVKNITSYALSCKGANHRYHMPLISSPDATEIWQNNSCINIMTGEVENKNGCSLSDFYDIGDKIQYKYMIFGVFMGNGGIIGNSSWKYIAYWFDENKKYIGFTNSHQYRKIKFNQNAKYVRICIIANDYTPSYYADQIYYYDYNINCCYKNITAINCRSCVLNPDYYKDLLIENVTFNNCGQSITAAPIDFEDGWQNGQDAYLNNLTVESIGEGSDSCILCSGFNYVFNNVNMGCVIRAGVYGLTMIGSSNISGARFDYFSNGYVRNGYPRIQDCTFNNTTVSFGTYLDSDCPRLVKNCTFNNCTINTGTYRNCNINNSLNNSITEFIGCNLDNFTNNNTFAKFFNCILINIPDVDNNDGIYDRCELYGGKINVMDSLFINRSKIINTEIQKHSWVIPKSLKLKNNIISSSNNLLILKNINENTEFIFKNNDVTLVNSNIMYFDNVFSGNFYFKDNKIKLDSDKYILTYDGSWHLPDKATNIYLINNIMISGREVLDEIANNEYVNIIRS